MAPPATIDLDTTHYYDAATAFTDAAVSLSTCLQRTVDDLAACESMGGNDEAGALWARDYDATVRATLSSANLLIEALDNHSALMMQAGRNYASADAAGSKNQADLPPDHPLTEQITPTNPPSAEGDQGSGLRAFAELIDQIGIPCPNGDTDRLTTAVDIWTRAAGDKGTGDKISLSISHLNDIVVAESIFVIEDAEEFERLVSDLHAACSALADTCNEHKRAIEDTRFDIYPILESLALELGITVAVTVLAAFVSFGASAIAGSANAMRATSAAARLIRPVVEALRVRVLVKLPTEEVGPLAARIEERARALLGKTKRQSNAPEASAPRSEPTVGPKHLDPPELTLDRHQVEKKFKHAQDFGIETSRGKAGFEEFEQALRDVVSNPSSQHIDGTYRGEACIINVDPNSKLAVVQRPDGSFLSGWELSTEQLESVLENGRLF